MRVLDLFCGAGGASAGYRRAGFEVTGVDLEAQPRYPYRFRRGDALKFLLAHGREFDLIHASPPCQAYSPLRHVNGFRGYPQLIDATRAALEANGKPWVIENVPAAPLHYSIELCGSMFGLGALSGDGQRTNRLWRQLRRHRRFETSFPILQPPCQHEGEAIGVHGGAAVPRPSSIRGGYQASVAEAREALGIPWMIGRELAQAIPPAYSEFIAVEAAAQISRGVRSVA